MKLKKLSEFSHIWLFGVIASAALLAAVAYGMMTEPKSNLSDHYPWHTTVATEFWVGEVADESNAHIPNHESAWVGDWTGAFGGVDDPSDRCGYVPCGFKPRENAFYVALPFNDIDHSGKPKEADTLRRVPWYTGSSMPGVSIMKNRWVEISYGSKTAYGQIEDVGPMNEDDVEYVFGSAESKYKAGIDLSPALGDYLETDGYATVRWRFVEAEKVPDGPWTHVITTSQVEY